jgi:hypothetical protein
MQKKLLRRGEMSGIFMPDRRFVATKQCPGIFEKTWQSRRPAP